MNKTVLSMLILAGSAAAASVVVRPPDAEQIVRQSMITVEADWKQAPNYSFVERDVQSKRQSQPEIKSYEVLMIEGSPYHRLIATGDVPLSPGEQAAEDQRMQAEIDKRQHEAEKVRMKRIAKYDRERTREHDMISEMANAFQFRLAGEETVDGHDCWVLDTSPRPGYQPKDRETRVLLGMSGRLWIDKEENQWVKARAEVIKPVGFFGFLAKVGPGTRFLLEQTPVTSTLWLPKHFNVQVNASALGFLNEDSYDDENYRDYKPMSETVAALRATK